MDDPRWLVDEMLGRLARYLRFLGYDAEYVRGLGDDDIVQRARAEARRVITRDRVLARRLPDSVHLTRTDIAGQLRELRSAFPSLRLEVRFDRCSVCNGPLSNVGSAPDRGPESERLPFEARAGRITAYTCSNCGHRYWEGSHTASIRARLGQWFPPPQDTS